MKKTQEDITNALEALSMLTFTFEMDSNLNLSHTDDVEAVISYTGQDQSNPVQGANQIHENSVQVLAVSSPNLAVVDNSRPTQEPATSQTAVGIHMHVTSPNLTAVGIGTHVSSRITTEEDYSLQVSNQNNLEDYSLNVTDPNLAEEDNSANVTYPNETEEDHGQNFTNPNVTEQDYSSNISYPVHVAENLSTQDSYHDHTSENHVTSALFEAIPVSSGHVSLYVSDMDEYFTSINFTFGVIRDGDIIECEYVHPFGWYYKGHRNDVDGPDNEETVLRIMVESET